MVDCRRWARRGIALLILFGLVLTAGCRRRRYENPITKDTQQPDKVLFDKAIRDIERARFEVARLTLNTLVNTYDTSEYLAKSKLAIADSWYREGGSHGLAQAEAEYKDFILFYPTMEEAAEAQDKICGIQYKQMEKADRDPIHASRAEDECRQVLTQFPNSKFAPGAQQRLREVQEVIAEHEFSVGAFYNHKGSNPAAANRLETVVNQYPLYSKADEALWVLADSQGKMGPRFKDKSALSLARIVKDYPLSAFADAAKKKLASMEKTIPEPDPVALARMKYELENRENPTRMDQFWGLFRKSPDVRAAAKSGTPATSSLKPGMPASIPVPVTAQPPAGATADVTVSTISGDSSALENKPDARTTPASGQEKSATSEKQEQPPQMLPSNRPMMKMKTPKKKKSKEAAAKTETPAEKTDKTAAPPK
jgi:outer membrane protein assembly factor BamD